MPLSDSSLLQTWSQDSIILGYLPHKDSFVRLEKLHPGFPLDARFCLVSPSPLSGTAPIANCTNIKVMLEGFENWLGWMWPNVEETEDKEFILKSGPQKKWAYDLPTIDADLEIRFDWQVDVRQAAGSLTGLGVMELQPRSPRTLYEVADTVRKIEDLLCLLTDRDRSLGWPQVKRQGDNDWSRFYHYSRSRRGQAEIEIYENWAPFSWIEAQFGSIADSWFAKHKVFAPTFNNYLATRRGSTLYLEHQFASLVWAMEAMSRISDKPTKDRKLCEKIKLLQENIRSHLSSTLAVHAA